MFTNYRLLLQNLYYLMSSRILCCPSATEQRKTLLDIYAGHMGFCPYDQTLKLLKIQSNCLFRRFTTTIIQIHDSQIK